MFDSSELIDQIKIEDLKGDIRLVGECCGIDVAKKLMKELGRTHLWVPDASNVEPLVLRYIEANRTRHPKKLAGDVGKSEQYVKRVLKRFKDENEQQDKLPF